MKIILKTSLSGPNFCHGPGDVVEWDDAESVRLIAADFAAPYRDAPRETAVAFPAAETTAKRKGKA